jgi:hypothetical protein
MTILAYGAKQVDALQLTLGGNPPKKALQASLASLKQIEKERFERRQAERAALKPASERARELLFGHLKDDPRLLVCAKEYRAISERRSKLKLKKPPSTPKVPPQIFLGSCVMIQQPPYSEPFDAQSDPSGNVMSDFNAGAYSWAEQSFGNGAAITAAAGVGQWFFNICTNPMLTFAANINYSYSWFDQAVWGLTAHTNASTALWIWGNAENGWVGQQNGLYPSWADGAGTFDMHQDSQQGTEWISTVCPVQTNNWYFLWVWSSTYLDSNTGDFNTTSFSDSHMSVSVPNMLVGG